MRLGIRIFLVYFLFVGLTGYFILNTVREQVRRMISGTRPPRVVMRFGYGHPVAGTPRRAPTDLLVPAPSAVC